MIDIGWAVPIILALVVIGIVVAAAVVYWLLYLLWTEAKE